MNVLKNFLKKLIAEEDPATCALTITAMILSTIAVAMIPLCAILLPRLWIALFVGFIGYIILEAIAILVLEKTYKDR